MASSLRIVCAAVAILCAAGAARAEAPAPASPKAELDVVVETGLLTPAEHRQSYLETMLEYARECLGGLVPKEPHPAGSSPPPGAARYRLFIEHRGKVEVDAMAAPAELVGQKGDDARQWITRQKGQIRFRLGRWDGTAYPTVDQWSSTFQTEHFLPMPADASIDERVQYQRVARNLATPEGVKSGILNHLLPIKLAETSGSPGSPQDVTLSVTNRSRWALRALDVTITWCVPGKDRRYRYLGEVSYTGRLEPGAQTELKGVAERHPSIFAWEYSLPPQIEARPVFVPEG
jgi:hypothetical protein